MVGYSPRILANEEEATIITGLTIQHRIASTSSKLDPRPTGNTPDTVNLLFTPTLQSSHPAVSLAQR